MTKIDPKNIDKLKIKINEYEISLMCLAVNIGDSDIVYGIFNHFNSNI